MSGDPFPQTVVAVVWDFDKTLSPRYMQEPMFAAYGIDADTFWAETRGLAEHCRRSGLAHVSRDTLYLNHLLTYVQAGRLPGLTNARLREFGAQITFFPGLPEALQRLKSLVASRPDWRQHGITLEHHVVSNGLYEMIRGCGLAAQLDGIWGCEFIEAPPPPGYLPQAASLPTAGPAIAQVAYAIDNTTKTRAIFEINKGSNTDPSIDVNAAMDESKRRVPMRQMIYVADGPSDIPVFSLIQRNGGRCFAVYDADDRGAFKQANELNRQQRVDAFGPADYRPGTQTSLWLESEVTRIADEIAQRRSRLVAASAVKPPSSY